MKLDIVNAEEQLNELELSDVELSSVYGGTEGFGHGFSHAARIHSYSVICDISIFSINVSVLNIISIATSTTQVCVNND